MLERIYITIMCCFSGLVLCLGMGLLVVVSICTSPSNEQPDP